MSSAITIGGHTLQIRRADPYAELGVVSQFAHGFALGAKRLLTVKIPLIYLMNLLLALLSKIFDKSVVVLTKVAKGELFAAAVVAPVIEEVAFRGILQPVVKTISRPIVYVLSPSRVTAERRKEISYTISRVVTSVLFGAAHLINAPFMGLPGAIVQSILAGSTGYILYSPLKEKHGLVASIGAHSGNNFCAVLFGRIMSSFSKIK